MKFKKNELLDRIDQIIADRRRETTQRNAKAFKAWEEGHAKHRERTDEDWKRFATTIQRRLRKGETVEMADVPPRLRSHYDWNRYSNTPPTPVTPDIERLQQLRSLLMATTEDVVTTSGLREAGFRDVSSLFR